MHIGHFALVADHGPVVIPTMIARDGEDVLAHGSTGSRWMRMLADGAATSLAVTAFDGLVVARCAFESSMHYRSAVLFGHCVLISDETERLRALDAMTESILPGRVGEVRRPSARELAATLVLRLEILEWSLKISAAWPEDDDDDVAGDAWAGVIPASVSYGSPIAAPDLGLDVEIPLSVLSRVEEQPFR